MIQTVLTCPLGHECETIKDNQIRKCAWYIEMAGKHPETNEKISDKGCAIAWLPVMQLEMAKNQMSTASATEQVSANLAKVAEIPIIMPKLIKQ